MHYQSNLWLLLQTIYYKQANIQMIRGSQKNISNILIKNP